MPTTVSHQERLAYKLCELSNPNAVGYLWQFSDAAKEKYRHQAEVLLTEFDITIKPNHWECDCVPNLGPSHCHGCDNEQGRPVPWDEAQLFHAGAKD